MVVVVLDEVDELGAAALLSGVALELGAVLVELELELALGA